MNAANTSNVNATTEGNDMTNLEALLPALRDMLAKERDKKIKDVGERAATAHPELIER
jgi:hypothetical protein